MNKLSTQEFVDRANSVHGDKYDYSKAVYKASNRKLQIVCSSHGPFFQTPDNHVNQKQGCPKCGNTRKGRSGGYSFDWLMKHPEKAYAPAMVYVTQMKGKNDSFIHLGITTHSVPENSGTGTVLFMHYMALKDAVLLEQQVLEKLKEYKYFPNHVFYGRTECLKDTPLVVEALREILPKVQYPHK